MADPTTVNTSLAIPIRGTDVGTWDLPVNGNFVAIDNMFGGVTAIALSNANVTLLSSQAQASIIRLTGTLANSVSIVMTSIFKGLRFDNQITNSLSSFAVFALTAGASYSLGIPPGVNDMFYDGTKVDYVNLGRIGEYVDIATAGLPTWVSASSKPPYLLCNGTTFSSATYPILANTLGTTTLPDGRGRVRMMSNQGTARVTVFNGDTLFLGGGDQQVQAHTHTGSGTTSGASVDHTHTGAGTTSGESATHTHGGAGTTSTESANHTHNGNGTTSGDSVDHTHVYTRGISAFNANSGSQISFLSTTDSAATSGVNQFHTHNYAFTTDGDSVAHTHTYSFTTGGQSVAHTHTYSFTTSGASIDHTHTYSFTTSTFGSGASLNMQPTFVGGITMIRAA